MSQINLNQLSVAELNLLRGSIDDVIDRRRQEELLEIRQKLDDLIETSGFTLEEIMAARAPKKTVPPKYRNPDNYDETWTGRGRRPNWVEQQISAGRDLEDFIIND